MAMGEPYLTDLLARRVEALADEFGVTLLVDGVVVRGQLTSRHRYTEWVTTITLVNIEVGNGPVDGATEPHSRAQSDRIIERWKTKMEAEGIAPGDEHAIEFPVIYLRDAVIESRGDGGRLRLPFLMIGAAHVGAMTVGLGVFEDEDTRLIRED